MKYFSHLCTAQDDDKFDRLFDVYSFEGYGVYWWLCEHVGRRKKTANDSPAFLFASPSRTSKVMERGSRRVRIATIIRFLDTIGLIEMEDQSDWLLIKIPKLNNYSAEWQKRLSKGNYGVAPELTPERLPSGLGREVVDVKICRKKREDVKSVTPPASTVESVEPSSEIEDPKARAEAMKVIKDAMLKLPGAHPQQQVPKVHDSGNGTIPTASGPEVDRMYENLGSLLLPDAAVTDILNAWWANKQGTHNEYALASMLDKHSIKGHDRTKIYQRLGVV